MGYTLKMANFVNNFQCIGGTCKLDCCRGWEISWTDKEVKKLKSSEHSNELDEIITDSFQKKSETLYKIKLLPDNDCPFHDKTDKLCKIQKELGPEFLSVVCRSYPMSGTLNNGIILKTRFMSCPAVFDMITKDEKACDVYTYSNKFEPEEKSIYNIDTITDVKSNPSLKYRNQLFDFMYGILSNKKRDIHTSLIIGTLAAQTLSKLEKSSPDRIPDGIEALSKQINNPALEESLSDIKPNYAVKLGTIMLLLGGTTDENKLNEILRPIYTIGGNNLSINEEKYHESFNRFMKCYENKPYAIRNIILNLFMCEFMPFSSVNHDIFGNYAYFCATAALIDFLGAAAAAGAESDEELQERFKTAVCLSAHPLCHAKERVSNIVDYLKSINCFSAAHLAILVKN